MKSFISILLLSAMLLSCVACDSDIPQNDLQSMSEPSTNIQEPPIESTTIAPLEQTTTVPDANNGPKHYEIDLNLDNYMSYLKYSCKNGYNERGQIVRNGHHTVSGVLTFAYYENVIVTFEFRYGDNYQKFSVRLDAAGNAEFNNHDYLSGSWGSSAYVEIVGVSGKVSFSL